MTARGRINARLDPEMAQKVAYLRRRTGLATSDVVRASIDHYYDAVRTAGARARAILESAGFIGGSSGPTDLSERYKEELGALLDRKHS